ncbi:DNA translocase FtsK [Pararhodobacter sp.]|uniref:DNA translocase FtsK n=1 Tax=Pararhodobacter sp. TaxID=2127056 RepID=UPI002AFE1E2E|nr:DNA translocase FtsK 4TM domain-containing protein [Pararhodobacter sp.]
MASYPSPQREPFLDSRLQEILSQRGKELLGLCLIGVGLILALVLGSYAPEDPSWWAATDEPARNALGRLGAGIAGPMMFMIGKASWGMVLALCVWGLRLVIHQGEQNIMGRTLFVPIAIALATIWLAMLVPSAAWVADYGLGGQFGDAVLGAVLTALPLTSTFGFNILTILVFGGTLTLWLYVLGSSVPEVLRIGGFLLSGLILSYAGLLSILGGSLRGVGGLAVRGHDGWQTRRHAQAQARQAAEHAAAAHPAWQQPLTQWPDQDHAYRAPRIHRAEGGMPPPLRAAERPDYAPYDQPEFAPTPPRNPDVHTRVVNPGVGAPRRSEPTMPPPVHPAPAPAEHWGQPERQGLLARVSNLGRRRTEAEPQAWAPEGELVEPSMAPQAMGALAPTDDRIRTRITDVIRTRKQVKPVLRFDPNQRPVSPPAAPPHVEPPLTAARRAPSLGGAAPARGQPVPAAPAVPMQGIGYSHSFGINPTLGAFSGAVQTGFDRFEAEEDALIEDDDDLDDRYEAPTTRTAQQPLNRRVVQTARNRTPAPSRQAKAEAQPTLPFEARRQAFELPPLSLLSDPSRVERFSLSNEALEENARMLESVLEDYGVRGEIVSVRPGPVVTMYELEPAPGLKASRVIGLSDDIARSMSALSARVSTVPGRSVIGIELPNVRREKVVLREILGARDFGDSQQKLPLALGKDIGGEAIVANLAKMPHLLIAGTTGSGKSVAINTMILSLLYKLTPQECRMIMIDPKMLELSVYDGIPHLLSPVVTDPKKAVVALKWVVGEMEERYRKMSKMGVRNIDGYNGRVHEALSKNEMFKRTVQTGFDDETGDPVFETEEFAPEVLPYIVVIVDEMADLMMVAGKEIEACIQRLAQMARASGIHLIMATQRPSVDVITGTIKANFPTRISFQVTSKIDSRTILGEQGAEQLLGMGDMLYMAGGSKITRIHGPFVSDEEVEEIVTHLKSFGPADYIGGVLDGPDPDSVSDIDAVLGLGDSGGEDALYDQAVAIVARDRKCSTSYIQRKLAIGYNKAARLVEQMEDDGVVSSANHVGKREILVPEGQ